MVNLLSHTAGLNIHGFGGYRHGVALPTVVQILEGKKPAYSPRVKSMFAPGLKFQYSGGGVMVSQLIVMNVTRQPYDKYMYNNVLKPLGMTSSTYVQPLLNIKSDLLATGYRANGTQVGGKYNIYPEQAAAGLWTNPTDLAKYIIEIQSAYHGKSHKILNQQITQLMLTPYIDKNAALGVFINDWNNGKYFGHDGGDEGFRAIYFGSVDDGNGVVIMVNSDNSIILEEVMNSIARVYGFKGMDQSVLKKEAVVADSVLQTYTGEYQLTPGILTITREGNRLYGQIRGQSKLELFAEKQNKFFSKAVNAEIEFIKDNEGNVIKAILYENGTHEAKKLK
jgi:CubicO group peptidase (beta-lactamase class C family)